MKTLNKFGLIATLAILLSGCGAIAVRADNAMGGHMQEWVYDSNKGKEAVAKEAAMKEGDQWVQKESFLTQCLMDETRSPEWCVKRADEAFSKKTVSPAVGDKK